MASDPNPDPPKFNRISNPGFTDHSFKTPAGADLEVRIWAASPPVSKPAPFVSYTHGGGFLSGNHYAPLAWMEPGFRQRGYHLVSHNYRLGPQANIDVQIQDCVDAIAWLRENLPSILGADKVDVDRYVICGESGGGALVTLMGHHLSPPPKAIVNAYGLVDAVGEFPLTSELPPGLPAPPQWEGEFAEEELDKFLEDRDPANVVTNAFWFDENIRFSEHALSEYWRTEVKNTRRLRLQSELHRWRSNPARMASLVRSFVVGTLHAERFPDQASLHAYALTVCPKPFLDTKTWYPPTAFLHGTADLEVPLSMSKNMAQKLREMGVPVVECYEPDAVHVFDQKYTSPSVPGWDLYIQPILDFCSNHISDPLP